MSLSLPKQSKFAVSHGPRTGCTIGAGNVLPFKPSQSKPWNHLQIDNFMIYFIFSSSTVGGYLFFVELNNFFKILG